ncbi:MAG TPA: N-acetylmuramoyl-L-alanine amidase [Terriglobales bacterium]|nr:N-acetylmuramoyl-L-alanine amidase [Terriglobales bacterium]
MDLRKPLPFSLTSSLVFAALVLAVIGPPGSTAARARSKSSRSSAAGQSSPTSKPVTVSGIRHWSSADVTHVAIDLSGPVKYKFAHLIGPERVYFDLENVTVPPAVLAKSLDEQDGFLTNIRVGALEGDFTRVALDLDEAVEYSVNLVPDPYRLEITFHRAAGQPRKTAAASTEQVIPSITVDPPKVVGSDNSPGVRLAQVNPAAEKQAFNEVREAKPDSNGERSLIRALGLKIGKIVIDPGHGGDDHGTMGPNGVFEKDVVLDVALRLGKLLQGLGAEVIYTRATDRYLPLESRTAIANREAADLFISIHGNSSPDRDARGVETYYLNFTTSKESLEVAARENIVSRRPVSELRDLVGKIAQQNRIAESHEFADDVQTAMAHDMSGERDRGVREAPFIVLTGANMPAILTEISFLSNQDDESNLRNPQYRQKIALALYDGISTYVNGLSGVASPSQSAASLSYSLRNVTVLPGAGSEMPPASIGWSDLMLGFIAANRPFIVIFFLLAAAWSFFLTSPTAPGQPAPVLVEANPGGAAPSVEGTFLSPDGEYIPRRKLHLVRRS